MKPNKILIIHGFQSDSKQHWFSSVKEKFQKEGYEVFVPDMPGSLRPKKMKWVETIAQYHPDESWILIGHSLGGAAILRYLENTDKAVGKVILVATPFDSMKFRAIDSFYGTDFNWSGILNKAQGFGLIYEDNDPKVPLEHGYQFEKYLQCKLNIINGYTHVDKLDLEFLKKIIDDTR